MKLANTDGDNHEARLENLTDDLGLKILPFLNDSIRE
jgi:hypothetical protein